MVLQKVQQELALVQELALDLYPLAEVKALAKVLEFGLAQDLALVSPHQWFQALEKEWDLLVLFAQDLAQE
jgi:hypothetical protein